jgi:amino acid transporter
MARDGLVPEKWADVNPRMGTPVKLMIGFGIFAAVVAALVPLGAIIEMVNIGTLFAFILVNVAWLAVGIVIYLPYGYSHSLLRHHYPDAPDPPEIEPDADTPETPTPKAR